MQIGSDKSVGFGIRVDRPKRAICAMETISRKSGIHPFLYHWKRSARWKVMGDSLPQFCGGQSYVIAFMEFKGKDRDYYDSKNRQRNRKYLPLLPHQNLFGVIRSAPTYFRSGWGITTLPSFCW